MLRLTISLIAAGIIILSARVASASTPQATPAVKDQVKAFYTAYTSGDVTAARTYWTPEGGKIFDRTFSRPMRVRCTRLHSLAVQVTSLQDTSAVADVVALVSSRSTLPGDHERFETTRSTITLAMSDSAWRITGLKWREEILAEAIIEGVPWRNLLRAETEEGIRGYPLVRELTRHGIDRFNRQDLGTAWHIVSLAAEIAKDLDDDAARSEVFGAYSILYSSDAEQTIEFAGRSLALADKTHDPYVIARGLQHYGRALGAATGRTPREPFERILAMADSVPSEATLANAASRLADHFNEEGDRRNALRAALKTLQYAKAGARPEQLISAHQNLGATYLWSGDGELALPHLKSAIGITRGNGFREALAYLLCLLAETQSRLGDVANAQASAAEALSIAESLGQPILSSVLVTEAGVLLRSGEIECAEADLNRMLSNDNRTSNGRDLSLAWGMLSSLQLKAGDRAEALRCALISEAIAEDAGLQHGSLEAAMAYRAVGKPEEAANELSRYLPTVHEHLDHAIPEPSFFWALRQSLSAAETELSDVLIDLGKPVEALTVNEQRRAQTLQTFGRARRPAVRSLTPSREHTRAENHLSALNKSLAYASEEDESSLREELLKWRRDLAASQAAEAVSDETQPLPELVPFGVDSLRLPPNTTALEYVVARERIIAFTITARPNGPPDIRAMALNVNLSALSRDIDHLLALIERRDPRFRALAASLYEALVQPVASSITRSEFLCILPDGILWKLPFHILRDRGNRYLGDRVCVYYSPSLRFLVPNPSPAEAARGDLDFVGLANAGADGAPASAGHLLFRSLAALPDAEAEVRSIAAIYDPRKSPLFTGRRAVEAVLKAEGARARILHIASHAILDHRAPMYSYLVLAPAADGTDDGLVEAREVADLSLHADVAILSACETARGEISPGEGVMGLSFAFLLSGVRTTVVSQWQADSVAARKLMIEFHRELSNGTRPPKAMQIAQQKLRRDPRYDHPYDWASFILLGAP